MHAADILVVFYYSYVPTVPEQSMDYQQTLPSPGEFQELLQFRQKTLIDFSQRKKRELHPDSIEVVTRVEWEDYANLEHVEQFRQEYSSHYKQNKSTMMLAHVSKSTNYVITWYVPESLTGILQNRDNLPKMVLKNHRVNKLVVAGACVYRVEYRVSLIT